MTVMDVALPSIGITATRRGLTVPQAATLWMLLGELRASHGARKFHHGDCVGGDVEGAAAARKFGYWLIAHPPMNATFRAWSAADEALDPAPYHQRNRDIVADADLMIGMSMYRPIPARQLEPRAESRVRIRPELSEAAVPMPVPTADQIPADAVAQVFAVGQDGEWVPIGHVPVGQHVTVRSTELGYELSVAGDEEFRPPRTPRYRCPFCDRPFRDRDGRCEGDVWTADGRRHPPTQPVPIVEEELELPPIPRQPEIVAAGPTLQVEWPDPHFQQHFGHLHGRQDPPAEFRLPRSTGDLGGDWIAAHRAARTATTDAQRAAVRLRFDDLVERTHQELQPVYDRIGDVVRGFAEQVGQISGQVFQALGQFLNSDWPRPEQVAAVDDPRARALQARRNRNTGPPVQRRPPRRIDARGVFR